MTVAELMEELAGFQPDEKVYVAFLDDASERISLFGIKFVGRFGGPEIHVEGWNAPADEEKHDHNHSNRSV